MAVECKKLRSATLACFDPHATQKSLHKTLIRYTFLSKTRDRDTPLGSKRLFHRKQNQTSSKYKSPINQSHGTTYFNGCSHTANCETNQTKQASLMHAPFVTLNRNITAVIL